MDENNRMGKNIENFQKMRGIKRKFHAKMGIRKVRNSMYLTEAEDIQKRWQKYTDNLYLKDFNDQDNHNAVIIHLEPDILE